MDKKMMSKSMDKKIEKNDKKDSKKDKKQTGKPVAGRKTATKMEGEKKGNKTAASGNGFSCKMSEKCGGCQYLHLTYQEQLEKKSKRLKELCGKFCKFDQIIGMEFPYYYRNKVHAALGEDRRHNIISGSYEESTHRIVPIDSCLLENQKADAIIVTIRNLMKSFKIRPFNEKNGYGLVRHVLIRTGFHTGEIMVVLVLTSPILPSKNNFVKALLKEHSEITTIVLNVNNRFTSMVLGDKEQVIYGPGYIEDSLLEKKFRISAKSFYQVNPVQTEKLYGKAIEFANLTKEETLLDAYCGTGTIGLIASQYAKEVIGVELNKAAVADARMNAKRNNVKNITFYEKDAGEFMVQMAEQNAKVDVVMMDPPRTGSDEAFLNAVAILAPAKVVYVSCNPETLARDLQILNKKGYRVKNGVGVDMFPWTASIEAVVLLEKTVNKGRR